MPSKEKRVCLSEEMGNLNGYELIKLGDEFLQRKEFHNANYCYNEAIVST